MLTSKRRKQLRAVAQNLRPLIQIDTINVVERAHHLTLWSRLGNYDKDVLHQLAYDDRRIFEYWAHAACYIPLKDYRYYLHPMKTRHGRMEETFSRRNKGDPALMDQVLERVKAEGPFLKDRGSKLVPYPLLNPKSP